MSRRRVIALRVVFALSLLLNAVFLGLWLRVAGLRDELNGGSRGLAGLSREVRLAVRDEARARRPEVAAAMERVGTARAAMFAAIAASPRDPARIDATMAEVRAATAALQDLGQDLLRQALD